MKKVCFVINNMGLGGGTERVALTIINALAARGYDILLLNLWKGDDIFFNVSPAIKVHCLFERKKSLYKNYFSIVRKLRCFFADEKIDMVINVESTLALFITPALLNMDIKHVNWEHYNFTANIGSKLRMSSRYVAAWSADTVVTLTDIDAQMWRVKAKPRARILPINNPMPFNQGEYSYDPDSRIVLSIGRFSHQKGFDYLLAAWKKVVMEAPGWELKIVGSGEKEHELRDQAATLGITDSVSFNPPTKDVEAYYKSAGIYCMSSRFEGLPMVLIEASVYGLPIVAFDCLTGPAEVVQDNESGLLAKPEDVDDLAAKLKYMISHREERLRFSRAAYQIAKKFELDTIIKKWEALIG